MCGKGSEICLEMWCFCVCFLDAVPRNLKNVNIARKLCIFKNNSFEFRVEFVACGNLFVAICYLIIRKINVELSGNFENAEFESF